MFVAATLVLAYCFIIGACVGSFLNVVAWRLPLGMSLVHPPSHCPACKTPIGLRDNVPIFGWLMLRGRCRNCGVWISPRYPLIELLMAVAFTLVAYHDLVCAGHDPARALGRPVMASMLFDWAAARSWIFHCTLVSFLAAIALLESEAVRPGRGLLLLLLLSGLVPPLAWPDLRPVIGITPESGQAGAIDSLLAGAQGLVVGLVCGAALAWGYDGRSAQRYRIVSCAAALGAAGLFLGLESLLIVITLATLMQLLLRVAEIWRPTGVLPRSAAMLVAAIVPIAFGTGPLKRALSSMAGSDDLWVWINLVNVLSLVVLTMAVLLGLRTFARKRPHSSVS